MTRLKLIIILFIAVAFVCKDSISQDNRRIIDSLLLQIKNVPENEQINIYNNLSKLYWDYSLDSSLFYANEALNLSHIIKDKKGLSDSYNRIGNVYFYKDKYEKAIEFYQKSIAIRKEINDKAGVAIIYKNIAEIYTRQADYKTANELYQKAIEISKEIEDKVNIASYNRSVGANYLLMDDYKKALVHYLISLKIVKELNNQEDIARLYNTIGNIYKSITSYDIALKYFVDALEIFKKSNNSAGISAMYNNIGIIYLNVRDYNKALEYFQESLDIEINLKDETRQSAAYNNIGTVYDELKNKSKALEYYNKSLELVKKYNNEEGISTAHNNIGLIYLDLGEFEKAFQYISKSLEINIKRNSNYDIANNYNNLAKLYMRQKKYTEAKKDLVKSIELSKQINAKDLLVEAYDFLHVIYSEQNNYQKALEYYKLYSEMNDSIFSKESSNRIAETKIKYETENLESENELLKKNNELHLSELRRQKIIKNYWIAFSVLILALAMVIFSRFSLKKKTNILLESKNNQLKDANNKLLRSEKNLKELNATKDKFFSIIAHDLKNPFQALLGFSETLYNHHSELNKDEIKEYSKIIYESSQNLFNLLGNLLQWSKSQLGNIKYVPEKLSLPDVLDETTSLLLIAAEKKNIKIFNTIPDNFIVYADKHIVSTVLRNLISNAIKFTNPNGEIKISCQKRNNEAIVSVSDNGKGIDADDIDKLYKIDHSYSTKGTANEQGTGLGLILCKELIQQNNGKIWCESTPGKGSKFSFTLPLGE
ncbi:MAG: hypothetical protein A2X13_02925 [Bacteroidetes bacterium GWC2_33_15]|nr:MAG: hypothetical protein A2X10_09460 [Bacteroidetes bacterium GWA2_33_15]OFX49504.1 MAG: hypothetical protein A2X13_02925 [Bacteroidetes bacterium GWC2_33_15]OFX63657.1 MAG: hypothetical protein A2X15_01300 [Bacteroidetes bacterium GWB2_32_14]OFX68871.1 MAG: hypothetical protein A2X14_13295 [Bacteroidetes bacterium GWD2_33_33]HAN17527.1 hypothetical protein [Bacteroidales bacterium]